MTAILDLDAGVCLLGRLYAPDGTGGTQLDRISVATKYDEWGRLSRKTTLQQPSQNADGTVLTGEMVTKVESYVYGELAIGP